MEFLHNRRRDALGSAVPGSIIRFLHAIKTLVVYDVQLTKDILLILIGNGNVAVARYYSLYSIE